MSSRCWCFGTNEQGGALTKQATKLPKIAHSVSRAGVARVLALPVAQALEEVEKFLELMEIEVVALPPEVGPIAIDAFARFGKGRRHAAQLSMGDCFAYACARHYGQPLLFTGSDFSRTNVEQA